MRCLALSSPARTDADSLPPSLGPFLSLGQPLNPLLPTNLLSLLSRAPVSVHRSEMKTESRGTVPSLVFRDPSSSLRT